MKKYYSFLILLLVATVAFGDQQVGSNLDLNGNQIKNADIDGGTASNSNRLTVPKNTKTTLDGLTRKEGTVVYSTDQAKLFVDNGSTLTPVGSGSGSSGEVNAVINPNAATDLTGYADSDAGSDVSRDTTAANLALYPTIETGVKVNADAATEYISYCGAMPAGLKNRKLKLEWFQVPESGYATGDQKLEVYSTTSSTCASSLTRLALSTDASSVTAIPNATGKFTTTADTNSDSYFQIRWVRVSGTKALTLQNIIYGPGIQPQGAVVTGYASFTPTITGVTTSASGARWLRVGEKMHLEGTFTLSASGSAQWKLALPSGYTFGSVVGSIGANTSMGYGYGTFYVSGASSRALGLYLNTDNTISFYDNASGVLLSSGAGASGQIVSFTAQIPIAEWAGSGTLNVISSGGDFASNSNSTNTSSDTTSFAYGPAGSNIPNGSVGTAYVRRVRLPRQTQADERIIVETNLNSSSTWVDAQSRFPNVHQGTSSYGIEIVAVNTTDVDIYFNQQGYAPTNATYAGNGSPWSGITSWKWRVRIVKNAEAVGFGAATATQSGLVSAEATGAEGDVGVVSSAGWTPIDSKKYKWYQIGKQVFFSYRIESTTASSSFSEFNFPLPSDVPLPSNFSTSGLNEWTGISGSGGTSGSVTGGITPGSTGLFRHTDGNYAVYYYQASAGAIKIAWGTLTWTIP